MNGVHTEVLAAHEHLQRQGWIGWRSEAFHHLPPPSLSQWLGDAGSALGAPPQPCALPGWTLQPADHPAGTLTAHRLDALDSGQRQQLFAGLAKPGEDEAAPFAWAHRALCREGLRLRIQAPAGARPDAPVRLTLRHQPRSAVEAPLLVLEVQAGVHCTLLETHDSAQDGSGPVTQNLQAHIHLAPGARLEHLRVVAPGIQDQCAHHLHVRLGAGAHYAQALVATGSGYHLQRNTIGMQGAGATACNAALLLLGAHQQLDWQVASQVQAPQGRSQVEALVLAEGQARAVANAHTRIAPGADGASVRQRLAGVALAGQPRLILRPHLEILHDNVQAAHGATWGALPEDALFYARQRGLDEVRARTLIIEGMAHAVLERGLQGSPLLAQWLQGGWLARAIDRLVRSPVEGSHA